MKHSPLAVAFKLKRMATFAPSSPSYVPLNPALESVMSVAVDLDQWENPSQWGTEVFSALCCEVCKSVTGSPCDATRQVGDCPQGLCAEGAVS